MIKISEQAVAGTGGLLPAGDAHFAWLLGAAPPADVAGLTIAKGGIDAPEVLDMLRGLAAQVRAACGVGAWLIRADREVVGMISFMAPPDAAGVVEIGFGVAASRRRRGFATRAVADLAALARAQGLARVLTAETAVWNQGSQAALSRAGFAHTHQRVTDEDGDVIGWLLALV